MNYSGKAAIITGSTKGIGRAIAEALLREGMQVCISARHASEVNRAVKELAQMHGERVTGIKCDVSVETDVRALVKHTRGKFGGVDVLINNAGVGKFGRVEEMPVKVFREVLETNLFGVFYCCRLCTGCGFGES
jgi:NAD(P)-dependent dehydrogenase (short-subunit alcohol dehydrogenase family)